MRKTWISVRTIPKQEHALLKATSGSSFQGAQIRDTFVTQLPNVNVEYEELHESVCDL
jgi:hypothetical protein